MLTEKLADVIHEHSVIKCHLRYILKPKSVMLYAGVVLYLNE